MTLRTVLLSIQVRQSTTPNNVKTVLHLILSLLFHMVNLNARSDGGKADSCQRPGMELDICASYSSCILFDHLK